MEVTERMAQRIRYKRETKDALTGSLTLNIPTNYLDVLTTPLTKNEEEAREHSEERSVSFGSNACIDATFTKYGIEQVLRPMGRPSINGA